MTKSYDIMGYTADADTWCVNCTHEIYGDDKLGAEPKYDHEGNKVHPIFADSETNSPSVCANCGAYIKENLTSDGVEYAWEMVYDAYEKSGNRSIRSGSYSTWMIELVEHMAWMNLGEDDKNRHEILRRILGEI